MLSNLMNNAADACDNQPGKIDLQLEANNEWVKIIIQDTGKGMSPELIDKIMHKMAITEGKESGHGMSMVIPESIYYPVNRLTEPKFLAI